MSSFWCFYIVALSSIIQYVLTGPQVGELYFPGWSYERVSRRVSLPLLPLSLFLLIFDNPLFDLHTTPFQFTDAFKPQAWDYFIWFMEDHEQFKLTFCFLGGKKIYLGDLVHLLKKKLSLLIYWDCLSTMEMTHAYPEGFRWHHKFTAGHHGPCPEQTEVEKNHSLDSSAKPTLPWVHFVPTEINGRWFLVYQRTIKRWAPYWFVYRKTTAESDIITPVTIVSSDFSVSVHRHFFQKDLQKEMRSTSKICVKPCFSTSPLSRHNIYCSKRSKGVTP